MHAKLYQMPLRFDMLMERNSELPECNLPTSIAQNIFLIISSKYNEHRFDSEYGCEIWERDFELITNPIKWQEDVNKSIISSLSHYEPRLERINVDTVVTEQPHYNPATRVHSIKKKIIVNVKGTIRATGEPFAYAPQLFISPISVD
jgi:phage baseplate assembly protein W